jgi:hypothetical protein
MAQSKNIAHGIVTLARSGTAITFVRSIQPPSFTREEVDATTLDSTVAYHIPGDPEDPGEVTIEMVWTPGDTNDELFDTDFNAETITSWTITYGSPITRVATFSGWVKSLSPAQYESRTLITRTIVLRLTTAITWT